MDKVIKEQLKKRFREPREMGQRRILFWSGSDSLVADELEEVRAELPEVKVLVLRDNNNFAAKMLLEHDDTESDYLIYDLQKAVPPEDDWLYNIRLYSEVFMADIGTIRLQEMGIGHTQQLRDTVLHYAKYMNAEGRRKELARYAEQHAIHTPEALELGMMSCRCGIRPDRTAEQLVADVICHVLSGGLTVGANRLYAELCKYELNGAFLALVQKHTGYESKAEQPGDVDLTGMCVHLLLTAAASTLPEGILNRWPEMISPLHSMRCYEIVNAWQQGDKATEAEKVLRHIETMLGVEDALGAVAVKDLLHGGVFSAVDHCLIRELCKGLAGQSMPATEVVEALKVRRTTPAYHANKPFYESLRLAAEMYLFYNETAETFHYTDARMMWKSYEEHYYRMDSLYRAFHVQVTACIQSGSLLSDYIAEVKEAVENLYAHAYLSRLGENWTLVSEAELGATGTLSGIPRQRDFYATHVANKNSRTVVIISDALRYEVAAELVDTMRQEMLGEVELSSMIADFPTSTEYGMAALLPHHDIIWDYADGKVKVKVDGFSTDGLEARETVLRATDPHSVVLRAKDFIKATKAQKREMVNGYDVVYIYHDAIDAAGHYDEDKVFEACKTAQEELYRLIRHVVNERCATNVMLTADHGFLYVDRALTEADKVQFPKAGRLMVKSRYAVLKDTSVVDDLMPVQVNQEGMAAYTPREYIRIPKQGDSARFVHGGASLQELMVPLVQYHYRRSDSKVVQMNADKYCTRDAEIELLAEHHRVSNALFKLDFYQRSAVGPQVRPATYRVYFTDKEGNSVSEVVTVEADRTEEDAPNRQFSLMFRLKSMKFDALSTYYLVVENSKTGKILNNYAFSINLSFGFNTFY